MTTSPGLGQLVSTPGAGADLPRTSVPVARHSVVLALARAEAVRLVRHPIALVGLALTIFMLVGPQPGRSAVAFDSLTTATTFVYGVFVFFAANLLATRDRRAGAEHMLTATATRAFDRVLALCLAALGPTLLAAVVVGIAAWAYDARDFLVVPPSFWQLAQGPVTVLGAALLGIMVARWAPYPGAPVLVMVAVVAWNVYVNNSETTRSVGMYTSWAVWENDNGGWGGMEPGSPGWHVVYLLGLCAMAAVGALSSAARPRLPLLVAGAGLTVATVLAGAAALP